MGVPIRVLVLEDSDDDYKLLLRELHRGGYEIESTRVDTAADMKTALDSKSWDIIISDYSMPQFNALDGLVVLKETGLDIPFIIVSGTIGEDVAVQAMKAGAHDYLMKDNLARMVPAVERELREAEVRRLRKRAEERAEHLNLVLRAVRNVNQLITKEKDRDRLLKGACENLIETRGYNNVWIALLDESGKLDTAAEAGLSDDFQPMIDRLKRGELTHCGSKALEQSEILVIEDPLSTCGDCPLVGKHHGRAGATIRLEYEGRIYGLMSVSIPAHVAGDKEERSLFKEVADDIAFALHAIEVEEARKRAEEETKTKSKYFRALIENSFDTIMVLDKNGSIRYISPSVERVLGYKRDEKVFDASFDFIRPEDREYVIKQFNEAIRNPGVASTIQLRVRHKDGSWRFIEGTGMSLFHEPSVEGFVINFQDITERKRAEEKIKAEKEKFETYIESMVDGLCVNDINGIIVQVNKAFAKMSGYKSPEELVGKTIFHNIASAEIPRITKKFMQSVKNKEPGIMDFEVICLRQDGSEFPVSFNIRNLREKDEYVGSISVARDITDRKRAEAALADEAIRRRILIEHSGDGIVVLDRNGKVYEANRRYAEMLGYTREEVQQLHVWDWDFQWTREQLLEMIRLVDETGDHFETRHRRKDGSLLDVEISTNGAVCSGQKLVFCVCRDISDRKRAEKALKESEERYRDLFNLISDAVYVIDKETGRIVDVNETACKMYGYSREEWLKMKNTDVSAEPDETRKATKETPETISVRYHKKKDGTVFPLEMTLNTSDLKGRKVIICTARDITERKKLEGQFHQAMKMETVGRLAGGIAHDFNNILAVILSYSGFIIEDLKEDDPMREDAQEIKDAGNRAAALTRQLLAFSRKETTQPKILNLNNIVQNLDKMLRRIIGEDIEFATIPAEDLSDVKADPGQIEQVLANLAVNARDAMPDGGKLTIETQNVYLDQEYADNHLTVMPGSYVMLAVSDTGCGMDAETLSNIFEPFFTTKEIGKGTGLGLSTVYGIVKQNNGYILAYSEPGEGTTFKIYLPRIEDAVKTVERDEIPVESLQGSETILLVEDDEPVRRITRRVLERQGYKIIEASDGVEALFECERHEGEIHLLLTDVIMPKMSGRELAKNLQKSHPDIKVLYMSGYTDNAIAHHGILDEGVIFIQKPFTKNDLLQKVREALSVPSK